MIPQRSETWNHILTTAVIPTYTEIPILAYRREKHALQLARNQTPDCARGRRRNSRANKCTSLGAIDERASIYPVIARSYLANTAYTRPEADRTSNLG